jgi:hypothetical protein
MRALPEETLRNRGLDVYPPHAQATEIKADLTALKLVWRMMEGLPVNWTGSSKTCG